MNWTETGRNLTSTPKKRAAILAAIDKLEWHEGEFTGPMAPVLALEAICRETRGDHRRVAWQNGTLGNGHALLGVESHFRSGVCLSYWADGGDKSTCVCHEFTPNEEAIQ